MFVAALNFKFSWAGVMSASCMQKKIFSQVSVFLLGIFCLSGPAIGAGVAIPVSQISVVENGWFGEGLAIYLASGGITGCGVQTEFAIEAVHPAYKEMLAMALSAATSGANVQLYVDQGVCVFGGRTRVISIRMMR